MSSQDIDKLIETSEQVVRSSRQKRSTPNPASFFSSTYKWAKKAERDEPSYQPNSRVRDAWLREFVRQEPHLASVLSTAVSIDVNRQYSLIGGRNQVIRYSKRLKAVENGKGWRRLKALQSTDFYNTDLGGVIEVETDGNNGPLLSLYHVDAAKCNLTESLRAPMVFHQKSKKPKNWRENWFYRITSQPNPDERFNQLGYCAISRCLKIAQIMIGVVEYNLEKLGVIAPNGLLLIESENLTQEMWIESTEHREDVYVRKTGNQYFDNMTVLVDRAIKASLVELSGMPDRFDPFKFTDYMMRAYALAFNRDVRSFWSVNSGSFGGGSEAQMQYERAYQGGISDFATGDQEGMQKYLPASVLFQYDVDDTRGKLLKAELAKAWTDVGLNLEEMGLSNELALSLIAKEGIIPDDWTLTEEPSRMDSEGEGTLERLTIRRKELRERIQVREASRMYPDESIVEWTWPNDTYKTLWKSGKEAGVHTYAVAKWTGRIGSRQRDSLDTRALYLILKGAIEGTFDEHELRTRLEELLVSPQSITELVRGIYTGEVDDSPANYLDSLIGSVMLDEHGISQEEE